MEILEQQPDAYRQAVAGDEETYWYRYGFTPSGWPAYVRTGKILDNGIESWITAGGTYYHFECRSSFVIMNCRDQATGTRSFGRSGGGFVRALVQLEYEKVRDGVYFLNPSPLSIVDIRTLKQIMGGCCPKALAALLLDDGAD